MSKNKKVTKQRTVTEELEKLYGDFFEGDVTTTIANLNILRNKWNGARNYIQFLIHQDFDTESNSYILKGVRFETDEELNARQQMEIRYKKSMAARVKLLKEAKDIKERKLYERLKEKFEE